MREVVISDVHFNYEDLPAYNLTLKFLKIEQPDLIYLLGDILDFYAVSFHDKDPKRKQSLQDELDYTAKRLAELRAICPKSKIVFHMGNHENRLNRYLSSRAEELRHLRCLQLDQLLGLEKLKIEFVEYGAKKWIKELLHFHGSELGKKSVVYPSRTAFLDLLCSSICGHYHTFSTYRKDTFDGRVYRSYTNGCLLDKNVEYAYAPNWQTGFTRVMYSNKGIPFVEQVEIIRTTQKKVACLIDGVILEY